MTQSRRWRQAPLFSVVMPVHNKRPHLARSIGSVLAQTCADFELVVVDDASTDGSAEVLAAQTDARIRVLHRTTSGPGGYAARNLGIEEARGEWVALIDADDEWFPEHLEQLRAASLRHPDVPFISAGWYYSSAGQPDQPDPLSAGRTPRRARVVGLREYLDLILSGTPVAWTSAVCFRRAAAPYPPFPDDGSLARAGDVQTWLELVARHGTVLRSPHIGARYHRDSVSMVTRLAPVTIPPFTKVRWRRIVAQVPRTERRLLWRYFCRHTLVQLVGARMRGQRPRVALSVLALWRCPAVAFQCAAWFLAPFGVITWARMFVRIGRRLFS